MHGASDEALAEVASIAGVTGVVALPGAVRAHRIETDTEGTAARVAMTLLAAEVGQVSVSVASLEEVYLHLIGNRGFEVRR